MVLSLLVLYPVDAAKMAISRRLKLRQRVNELFSVSMIIREYRDFFAPIFLQLNSGVLFSANVVVNLRLSICARFTVYGSSKVVDLGMLRM